MRIQKTSMHVHIHIHTCSHTYTHMNEKDIGHLDQSRTNASMHLLDCRIHPLWLSHTSMTIVEGSRRGLWLLWYTSPAPMIPHHSHKIRPLPHTTPAPTSQKPSPNMGLHFITLDPPTPPYLKLDYLHLQGGVLGMTHAVGTA